MTFERVYTVWEYYDGPRSGIANYHGVPHYYECEWEEADDEYASTFTLRQIDEDTFKLALEQWSIWREWEIAYHRGERKPETHPGYRGQNARYDDLEDLLKQRIDSASAIGVSVQGTFRPLDMQPKFPHGVMSELEVQWSVIGTS